MEKFLPVKSDLLFKLFFADERNEEFLVCLLKAILYLPDDEYESIEIVDPFLLKEYKGDKLGILDVKLYTKSRKIIHIEIQLKVTAELKNRVILYSSKLITEQIGEGDPYTAIHKVISIIITDENLIQESKAYHHKFTFYDNNEEVEFTDLIEVHTLELRKLPHGTDGSALYDWARFIAADSEQDLNEAGSMNQEVSRAVLRYKQLTSDERTRMIYEYEEKARKDQGMFARHERREGKLEIARNMLADKQDVEKIVQYTGLSFDEIKELE